MAHKAARPGRPRAFDTDAALDKALTLFWSRGYEGTSIADLTEAMGINRPSLYAAFGDKEQLFLKALDRYVAGPAAFAAAALAKPTADEAVESLFREGALALTKPGCPRGCLAVHGALACGEDASAARAALAAQRDASEAAIRNRLEQAQRDGDLSPAQDAGDLAKFVAAMFQGMAVQAAGGAEPAALARLAEHGIAAWRHLSRDPAASQ